MGEDSADTGHPSAQAMLDLFASVGATHFDITWTTRAGDKEMFRAAHRGGWIHRQHLAHHQPVEQHAHGSELLLHTRRP